MTNDALSQRAVRGAPSPDITPVSAPFWDAARAHRLLVQHCEGCGRNQFPPTMRCPSCGAATVWVETEGRGVIHTFTVMRRAYHPSFELSLPYAVAVIQLDEGPMMLTDLIGADLGEVEVGRRVTVWYDDVGPELTIPRFALA